MRELQQLSVSETRLCMQKGGRDDDSGTDCIDLTVKYVFTFFCLASSCRLHAVTPTRHVRRDPSVCYFTTNEDDPVVFLR